MLFSLDTFAGFVFQTGLGDEGEVNIPEREPFDVELCHIGSNEAVAIGLPPAEYAMVNSEGESVCIVSGGMNMS